MLSRRPPRYDRSDTEYRRHTPCQGVDVHNMTDVVERGDGRRSGRDPEVVRPVVLDENRPKCAQNTEHPVCRDGRSLRAGRIRRVRLSVKRPRAGLLECAG